MARLCVVGTGYVGLVTGACLAGLGHGVRCVDVDSRKVEAINDGKSTIYEPGLGELVKRMVRAGRLCATTSYREALADADFTFICVGTPSQADGSTDLAYICEAGAMVADALAQRQKSKGKTAQARRHILIVKSTVPPGTTESLEPILREAGLPHVGLCMNPEFLREGNAVYDFMKPDRIVVGAMERKDAEAVMRLYSTVAAPKLKTDLRTAEMIKYASNSFLATKISFANELANMCEKFGVDVYDVADGMGHDRRIGRAFLNAGAGFGGSCFKKDVSALLHEVRHRGAEARILNAVLEINEAQPYRVVELLREALGPLTGARIALLGLAFKDNTDDVRDSAAIKVARALVDAGANVIAYDPQATANAKKELGPRIEYAASAAEALKGADACALVTEWPQFAKIPMRAFRKMKRPLVIEGRNVLDKKALKKAGIKYAGIGRKKF
ncbi:MAG: UDP-glucose/GDP-mannose dehydrogenase family protein [Candidatus Burarchaeum sp.]|nr:UDP-glucose/GDP-mannose dehydrogenase family protein [Candidatus Burarchaeum sp.]MDO8340282.1 UDP-glucose/GDP-mannose dehydrogenase family protein [Candidatus Burarchaeum sp.]